jgi:hypothetical protein
MTTLTLRARSSSGPPIHDLAGWEHYASTTGRWADGFSGKELARLWLARAGHRHVEAALVDVIPGLRIDQAIAEAHVSFDKYEGGVRNHDVLAYGQCDGGRAVIGVEGKVNESLDSRLKGQYAAAGRPKREGKNTNLDRRSTTCSQPLLESAIATIRSWRTSTTRCSRRSLEPSRPRSQRRRRPPSSCT